MIYDVEYRSFWWRLLDGSSWLVSIIDYMTSTADVMYSCVLLPSWAKVMLFRDQRH